MSFLLTLKWEYVPPAVASRSCNESAARPDGLTQQPFLAPTLVSANVGRVGLIRQLDNAAFEIVAEIYSTPYWVANQASASSSKS